MLNQHLRKTSMDFVYVLFKVHGSSLPLHDVIRIGVENSNRLLPFCLARIRLGGDETEARGEMMRIK